MFKEIIEKVKPFAKEGKENGTNITIAVITSFKGVDKFFIESPFNSIPLGEYKVHQCRFIIDEVEYHFILTGINSPMYEGNDDVAYYELFKRL